MTWPLSSKKSNFKSDLRLGSGRGVVNGALTCSCFILWFYRQLLDKGTVNSLQGCGSPCSFWPWGALGASGCTNPKEICWRKSRRLCPDNEIRERMKVGRVSTHPRPLWVLALFRLQTGFLVAMKSLVKSGCRHFRWTPVAFVTWRALAVGISFCLFCEGREGSREKPQRKWGLPSLGPLLLPDQFWSWRAGCTSLTGFCSLTPKGFPNCWFLLSSACLPYTHSAPYMMWSFSVVFTPLWGHLHLLVLWSLPIISKLWEDPPCVLTVLYALGTHQALLCKWWHPQMIKSDFTSEGRSGLWEIRDTDCKRRSEAVFPPRQHDRLWRKP